MNLNARLSDAVETADALLEQLGIVRQIEEHEMVRELEVASLAADLGAEQDARAVFARQRNRGAVALDERHLFMEQTGVR